MATPHLCHWPGCTRHVPPAMFACREHWMKLPAHLRREIWRTYMPGQETRKDPSAEYLAAARAVIDWVNKRQG